MNIKLDENTGKRWLQRHGGDVKCSGVGHTIDVRFHDMDVNSNIKDANKAYLSKKHGKGSK